MRFRTTIGVLAFAIGHWASTALAAELGDPAAGRQVFRACAACHSLTPGRHLTGPSLARIWGRKAATVDGFTRYSEALERAEIVWDERTLDAWLADPRGFLPGNRMTFRGLADEHQRRDLIAFLRSVAEADEPASGQSAERMPGEGMAGMMRQPEMLDLKGLGPNNRIVSIGHCRDTYTVTTETGEAHQFWEFNLRFKTDGSAKGPVAGRPVIIPASMMGDRVFVIFSAPGEISTFIEANCPQ